MSLVFLILFVTMATIAWGAWKFAPWVPARRRDLERIIKLAALPKGAVVYELGSGEGRVTDAFARAGCRATGIELAWPLYLAARVRAWRSKSGAKFHLGNLFNFSLRDADAVFFFAMPESIEKFLKSKLEAELKPGALALSYVFPVPGWTPEVVDKPSEKEVAIYRYRIRDLSTSPAAPRGRSG